MAATGLPGRAPRRALHTRPIVHFPGQVRGAPTAAAAAAADRAGLQAGRAAGRAKRTFNAELVTDGRAGPGRLRRGGS